MGTEIDKVFKGKDHSSSRKETSKERKLERSEGGIKESEIGCNMTQSAQSNFTKESTLHQTSFHRRGRERGRDSPATELGRGMRYRGMEWAEWEDMLSRLRSGILLRL